MPAKVREQVKLLKHVNWSVRAMAAEALGELKHASAVPPLAKALQDKSHDVRTRAAQALGNIKHESAIPHLIRELQENDWFVNRHATRALGMIGRAIQGKAVGGKKAKALQLVGAYFHEYERPQVVLKAYHAALKGKITKENARLYVKQLRALKGSVK